jgi:ubiquinone biosynthesis protein UbiJ
MKPEKVDWEELFDHLAADFDETRSAAAKSIKRLQHLVDAMVTCKPESRALAPEQLSVKQLVNDLKTVERHIKREVNRLAADESAKRPISDDQQHGQAD